MTTALSKGMTLRKRVRNHERDMVEITPRSCIFSDSCGRYSRVSSSKMPWSTNAPGKQTKTMVEFKLVVSWYYTLANQFLKYHEFTSILYKPLNIRTKTYTFI